jgi:serine/threonine protein phosphatase PrpC
MALPLQVKAFLGTSTGAVRAQNEDAGHVSVSLLDRGPARALLIVADGWQGKDREKGVGRAASELVVNTIREELRTFIEQPEPDSTLSVAQLVEWLASAVASANAALYVHQGKPGIVTGLACVLVQNELAAIVNNADCRVYLLRSDELRLITNNYPWTTAKQDVSSAYGAVMGLESAVQIIRWLRGRRIDLEFARKANSPAAVQINLWTESLQTGDRLLLGSDGLWGPLDDDNIALCLRETDSREMAVQRLINAANTGGGPDNITAIVCDLTAEQAAKDDGNN